MTKALAAIFASTKEALGCMVKTVSVRITEEQHEQLREIAELVPGGSVNGFVQRGVELLLEVEGPVYREHGQRLRAALTERQPVRSISR
jgi:hypothetical protein